MQNYGKPTGRYPANGYSQRSQNVSSGRYRGRQDTPVSVKYERITPIKPTPQPHRTEPVKKSAPNCKEQSNTTVRDFLFGFAVGLVIFGIAAAIICSALIKLI